MTSRTTHSLHTHRPQVSALPHSSRTNRASAPSDSAANAYLEVSKKVDERSRDICFALRECHEMEYDIRTGIVSELRRSLNDLRSRATALPTADADLRERVEDLFRDLNTLATRVSIVNRQEDRAVVPGPSDDPEAEPDPVPSLPVAPVALPDLAPGRTQAAASRFGATVHLGSCNQRQLPDGQEACSGIAGTFLQAILHVPAQALDIMTDPRSQKGTEFIDIVLKDGIAAYLPLLQKQRASQAKLIEDALRVGVVLDDPFAKSKQIPFEPSNYKGIIAHRVISDYNQPDCLEFFAGHLRKLCAMRDQIQQPLGVGITTGQGKTYALAIFAPNKIIFFDSHGSMDTSLATDKAYMLSFKSIEGAARFLAELVPHKKPEDRKAAYALFNPRDVLIAKANEKAREELGRNATPAALQKRAAELRLDSTLKAEVEALAKQQAEEAAKEANHPNSINFFPVKLQRAAAADSHSLSGSNPSSLSARIRPLSPPPISPRRPAGFDFSQSHVHIPSADSIERDYDSKLPDEDRQIAVPASHEDSASLDSSQSPALRPVPGPDRAEQSIPRPVLVPPSAATSPGLLLDEILGSLTNADLFKNSNLRILLKSQLDQFKKNHGPYAEMLFALVNGEENFLKPERLADCIQAIRTLQPNL